jgi:hypothetical protein
MRTKRKHERFKLFAQLWISHLLTNISKPIVFFTPPPPPPPLLENTKNEWHGQQCRNRGLVPFGFITSFILIFKPLWIFNFYLTTEGFAKQIKLMQKTNDDDDDSPQHLMHHNCLKYLRIVTNFLTSLRTWGSSLNQFFTLEFEIFWSIRSCCKISIDMVGHACNKERKKIDKMEGVCDFSWFLSHNSLSLLKYE